jgi:thiamine biosynthesis lipoprotein
MPGTGKGVRLVRDAWQFESRAMGSPLRLTLHGVSAADAAQAWRLVREDVERSEATLSRFRLDSDLSRLNAAAGSDEWVAVAPRLYGMLGTAERARRVTDGRFDPRVIRILEKLGERGGVTLPAPAPDDADRSGAWLEREPRGRRVRLKAPVDSGGIGKGLALRWALAALERAGLGGRGCLLDAGGDLVLRGHGPDGGAWRIGIEDPAARGGEPLAVIEAGNAAVVTSSTAIRRWQTGDGRAVHHLIDPASGEPGGGGLQAVTVLGPDPAWAEVWSKALFLAGPSRIGPEARARGLAAWWVEPDGSLHLTPAAQPATAWLRAAAA